MDVIPQIVMADTIAADSEAAAEPVETKARQRQMLVWRSFDMRAETDLTLGCHVD